MILRQITTTLAACLWASASLADDAAAPQPSTTTDILGFQIGMTSQDALTLMQQLYPNSRPQVTERPHRQSGQRYTDTIALHSQNNGQAEKLVLFFTGHFSGNRIYAIQRSVTYPFNDQASLPETRNGILGKYGLPTLSSGGLVYQYVFNPDPILLGSPDEVQAIVDSEGYDYAALVRDQENGFQTYNNMTTCLQSIANVQNPQFFNASEATGNPPPGCTAALDIKLNGDGALLRVLNMRMADYQFVLDAAKIDQAQDAANATSAQPTAATPKL